MKTAKISVEIKLDPQLYRWLQWLRTCTGTEIAEIIVSMLDDIRVDDELNHDDAKS